MNTEPLGFVSALFIMANFVSAVLPEESYNALDTCIERSSQGQKYEPILIQKLSAVPQCPYSEQDFQAIKCNYSFIVTRNQML